MEKKRYTYFKESYQRGSDIWSEIPLVAAVLNNLPKEQELCCLDIGCGMSDVPEALMRRGFYCIGIDEVSEAIEKQKRKLRREGLEQKGRFLTANLKKLPFKEKSFDMIFDIQTFQYLNEKEWENYKNEMKKVLKENGYYLNVSLSKNTKRLYGREMKKGGKPSLMEFGIPCFAFCKDDIQNIFGKDMEIIKQEEHSFPSLSDPQEEITLLFSLMKKPRHFA